jgi:hypothetical protein
LAILRRRAYRPRRQRLCKRGKTLSPWRGRTVGVVMVTGFSALILLSVKACDDAPPIPPKSVAPRGEVM